jgi:hypothetical protein
MIESTLELGKAIARIKPDGEEFRRTRNRELALGFGNARTDALRAIGLMCNIIGWDHGDARA